MRSRLVVETHILRSVQNSPEPVTLPVRALIGDGPVPPAYTVLSDSEPGKQKKKSAHYRSDSSGFETRKTPRA